MPPGYDVFSWQVGSVLCVEGWSFTAGKPIEGDVHDAQTPLSATISKDLKARGFKFVGPTIVYAWMQAVGITNDHVSACFRRAQILEDQRP